MPPFRGFSEPTGDRTYSAQLQEWADHFHVSLAWRETPTRLRDGSTEHRATPIVNGYAYEQFTACNSRKQAAKNMSAGLLISSGLL
ncbi:hypothetical protein FS749_002692 [Ceratobasidium sp. UAMH 11750]|nr:hypothetical protein FS749_002692 [Ceratobasidium sp. UAMH 11750]